MTGVDVIDSLAGLTPDSPLARIRDRKPVTREYAQASHRVLFKPADITDVTLQERLTLAVFVADLHAQDAVAAFYRAQLARTAPTQAFLTALSAETERGRTAGPYGTYPKGPLTQEDLPGLLYNVAEAHQAVFGARLTAALAHVHMLVFHPRDANAPALQRLLDAGWSNTGIVTLSQLAAFLSFQIRAAAGLRTLAGSAA